MNSQESKLIQPNRPANGRRRTPRAAGFDFGLIVRDCPTQSSPVQPFLKTPENTYQTVPQSSHQLSHITHHASRSHPIPPPAVPSCLCCQTFQKANEKAEFKAMKPSKACFVRGCAGGGWRRQPIATLLILMLILKDACLRMVPLFSLSDFSLQRSNQSSKTLLP